MRASTTNGVDDAAQTRIDINKTDDCSDRTGHTTLITRIRRQATTPASSASVPVQVTPPLRVSSGPNNHFHICDGNMEKFKFNGQDSSQCSWNRPLTLTAALNLYFDNDELNTPSEKVLEMSPGYVGPRRLDGKPAGALTALKTSTTTTTTKITGTTRNTKSIGRRRSSGDCRGYGDKSSSSDEDEAERDHFQVL